MQVQTKTSFEIEITLLGDVELAHRSGYENLDDDEVLDVEIIGVDGLRYDFTTKTHSPINLLNGVNLRSPDVQKLLSNMIDFLDGEAETCLLNEVSE